MLTHRPVQEADISLICQFPQSEKELYFMYPKASYPLTREQLQAAIDQRTDSTVVLSDDKVSGFANFCTCELGNTCAIGNVIVGPESRKRGVGTYLIETMIQLAYKKHNVKEVQISCFNKNAAGLLLYRKLGFRPFAIEERHDVHGSRVALIHLKLYNALGLGGHGKERGNQPVNDAVADEMFTAMKCLKPESMVNPTVLTDKELQDIKMPTLFSVGENEKIHSAHGELT